jgi:hypothetical protein
MTERLNAVLALASTSIEVVWLKLQIWALHAEIHGLQLLAWLAANPDGATGTACGLAGAFVLSVSRKREALGWLLFLASNAGLIALGLRLQRPDIVILQCGFTITSLLGLYRTAVKPWLHWDDWRGDFAGNPTMYIKRLVSFRGLCLDLHKMVAPDNPGCFHTHPARAVRFILWNGYGEEIECFDEVATLTRTWRPGMVGVVRPYLSHRIASLPRGTSYSLWLRAPKTHKTLLRGPGWSAEDLSQNDH